MSIRERLLAFAAGSPIGDDRSPRPTEPYGEYELDRRCIKWSECIFRFAVVSVALLVLGCALSGIAYAAQKGQWSVRDSLDVSGSQATDSKRYVVIRWSDIEKDKFIDFKHGNITAHEIRYEVKIGNGSANLYGPIYVDKNGKTVSSKTAKTKKLSGSLSDSEFLKSLAPSWAPDGWEIAKAAATGQESTGTGGGPHTDKDSAAKDPDDLENQLIKDHPPKFALNFEFFKYSAENLAWSFCRGLAENATSLAEWCISLVSSTADTAFTSDFTNGPFAQFYTMASTLSKNAFQPYAFAFLGLTFGVALMHQLDVRRKMAGIDIMASLAFVVMMFAVSYTLIVHAMDICACIYILAQNLVRVVNIALASVGIEASKSLGIKEQVIASFDSLTYAQASTSFILLLLAIVALVACVACLFCVLTTIFVRVGEIYLRAAASPLCLAFFADDRSRAMGVGYLKRFAAVCFQAVMIVIAIGMIPLIMTVASELIAPITSDTSSLSGFGDAVAALIPSMCAVLCITEIVNKSKLVANSLFGLA